MNRASLCGRSVVGRSVCLLTSILLATATATATATAAATTAATTAVAGPTGKSISGWVTCNGTSDESAGVARAFAASAHSAFTLIVDCPVRIHIGSDIARAIFIDDGTAVAFTASGKFTVDNVLIPAFVIADSSNITLTGWNVEYDGGLPVDPSIARTHPANAFNDMRITPWLAANRGITFDRSQGSVNSIWVGPTNVSALFFITGDAADVNVTGMRVYAPAAAGAERFAPMVFSLSKNYKSRQTVTAKTPLTGRYVAIPHDLTFSDISLDGTYMGWQGNAANVLFENVQSHRYGDLQDADGKNVGGVGDWFAPPHLFYLNYADAGDPELFNRNIRIRNVVDDGPRIGTARDTKSGNALSLKIGCVSCSVDHYVSNRPDGFLDVLSSNGLTVANVAASYDSTFENNQWPAWRFPSAGYSHVTFENIVLKDTAAATLHPPIDGNGQAANDHIVFSNVRVEINRWAGGGGLLPDIAGQGNDVALDYVIAADATRIASVQKANVSLMLRATPSQLSAGGDTVLTWVSREAGECSASGTWSGVLAAEGSRTMTLSAAGDYDFAITCRNSHEPTTVALRIVAVK